MAEVVEPGHTDWVEAQHLQCQPAGCYYEDDLGPIAASHAAVEDLVKTRKFENEEDKLDVAAVAKELREHLNEARTPLRDGLERTFDGDSLQGPVGDVVGEVTQLFGPCVTAERSM